MEDTELRGSFIPRGDTVMTIQASANRDEDVFEDGENYNALREPNPHQAFGNGPHHRAGAHLSRRTVGDILMPMLFERFPNMTLPDPASVRWHGFGFRGRSICRFYCNRTGARERRFIFCFIRCQKQRRQGCPYSRRYGGPSKGSIVIC
jgi:hypothetical protein